MCSHVDCLPLPSCYLIIVSVAPAVSPSLPLFVSLYSSPCVCSPVLIRCLSCVVCYIWVLCWTVLQSSACLLVFPLWGGFCSSLFYIIIKRTISSAFESSTPSLTWQNGSAKMRTQQRRGLDRPPPATISSPLYQRILQFEALSSCRQQGNDVRRFAMEFSGAAEGLDYNDEALKDLFNSALDEPLSWWKMRGLDHLTFGEFVEALARSPAKVAGVPQVVGDKAAAPPVAVDGAAVPLLAAVRAAAHNGMPRLVRKLEDSPMRSVQAADFPPMKSSPVVLEAMVAITVSAPEPTESAPEPTPSREPTESVPEPAPPREPTESAPEPAPFLEPMESAPEPAPFLEPMESAPEPVPFREPTQSAPFREPTQSAPFREPTQSAPFREPTQSAPFREPTHSAPVREPTDSAPEHAPVREPTESAPGSAPFREPTQSAPFRDPTQSAPFREPRQSTPVLDPAPVWEHTEPAPGPAPPWHPCVPIAPGPLPLHGPGPPPS